LDHRANHLFGWRYANELRRPNSSLSPCWWLGLVYCTCTACCTFWLNYSILKLLCVLDHGKSGVDIKRAGAGVVLDYPYSTRRCLCTLPPNRLLTYSGIPEAYRKDFAASRPKDALSFQMMFTERYLHSIAYKVSSPTNTMIFAAGKCSLPRLHPRIASQREGKPTIQPVES
jgi:hypothetical protein